MIAQRLVRTPQCPPGRLPPTAGNPQPQQLLLIEPVPHERVRRRGKLLACPGALADHADQLLAGQEVALAHAQQLRGPRPGRDPERDQRPVPVRPQRREQPVEPVVGDRPRDPLRHDRPVTPRPLGPPLVHRVVMRVRPAAPAGGVQRERVQHRPGPAVSVEVVEPAQHRLAMRHRGRRIPVTGRRLPGHRVRRSRRPRGPASLLRPGRLQPVLDRQLDPAAEVPGLDPGRPVPLDIDSIQEPPPPQQVDRIRPQRRRRPPGRQQVPQEHRHRLSDLPIRPDDTVRLAVIPGRHQPPRPWHH